jgi:hypothetical protein
MNILSTAAHAALTRACLAIVLTAMSLAGADLVIPGDANIYGAGHLSAPAPGGAGAGQLPPVYAFVPSAGLVLTFSSVTGTVRIDNNEHPLYTNGPDGGLLFSYTNVWSYGGISGIAHHEKTMFLAGVFLDDTEPSDPAPATLDFSAAGLTESFSAVAPQLRQVFFVGDGRTGTGAVQRFIVPPGATRLFLGFADSWNFSFGSIEGYPGWYDDDDGLLSATFSIAPRGPDFNCDGAPDILWRNSATGENYVWSMNGVTRAGGAWLTHVPDLNWQIVGVADFNKDGKPDILWRNSSTGENYVWYMNGTTRTGGAWLNAVADLNWKIAGTGDFNGDGNPDILWRNSSAGENYVWFMNGIVRTGGSWVLRVAELDWKIVGVADFNRDSRPDILWRNAATGENYVWYMKGATRIGGSWIVAVPDLDWKIAELGDFNADGSPDIVWRNSTTGDNYIWFMNGAVRASGTSLLGVADLDWRIAPGGY